MDIITRLRLYFRPSGVVVLVWPAGVGWLVGSWVVSLYLSLSCPSRVSSIRKEVSVASPSVSFRSCAELHFIITVCVTPHQTISLGSF